MPTTVAAPTPLLTAKPWEVAGVSRTAWFALRAAGRTPPGVRLPGRSRELWKVEDVTQWVADLPTSSRPRRRASSKT